MVGCGMESKWGWGLDRGGATRWGGQRIKTVLRLGCGESGVVGGLRGLGARLERAYSIRIEVVHFAIVYHHQPTMRYRVWWYRPSRNGLLTDDMQCMYRRRLIMWDVYIYHFNRLMYIYTHTFVLSITVARPFAPKPLYFLFTVPYIKHHNILLTACRKGHNPPISAL